MSTILFCAQEFGLFAAWAVKSGAITADMLPSLIHDLGIVSGWNARAYSARYSEYAEPNESAEIERFALDYLAGRLDMESHFGPILYNCDGLGDNALIEFSIQRIEETARNYINRLEFEKKRAQENAAAFDEIGALPELSNQEIADLCRAAGCDRVIEAVFCVDESDCYTDYYGGRTARRVVIGFGKGKRENFLQLRKAAALFPPTKWMSPGHGIFFVRVIVANEYNRHPYYKGSYSPFHSDAGNGREFSTREAAQAFIDSQNRPYSITDNGLEVDFCYDISETSIEHRENYSMGGGNYLGRGRYSGWKVSSRLVDWFGGDNKTEFFNPANK